MSDVSQVLTQAERSATDLAGDDPKWSAAPVDFLYGNRADTVGVGTLAKLADVQDIATATSARALVGQVVETGKRAARRGMRWYVEPFIDQTNLFNHAVVSALHRLVLQMDRFEMRGRRQTDLVLTRLHELEARVAELEQEKAGWRA